MFPAMCRENGKKQKGKHHILCLCSFFLPTKVYHARRKFQFTTRDNKMGRLTKRSHVESQLTFCCCCLPIYNIHLSSQPPGVTLQDCRLKESYCGLTSQVADFVVLNESFLLMGLASQVANFVVLNESFPLMGLASQVANFVVLNECFPLVWLVSQVANFVALSGGFIFCGLASQVADFVALSRGFLFSRLRR